VPAARAGSGLCAVRAATGTPPAQPLSESGYGFLLANWSIVHGFAHLALGRRLCDAQGNPIAIDILAQTLLPSVLQHLRGEKKPR
jgi:hypothetical protein